MRKLSKRMMFAVTASVAMGILGLHAVSVKAADYPTKPITMIVGYKAGGQTDLVGRATAKVLSEQLGVPVNVVNKPGGGGALAARQLKQFDPDGYTFLFHPSSVINLAPFLVKRVDFKPDDFDYAGMITAFQTGLATQKDSPFNNLKEFIAWAKENPGFRYGALSPSARLYINEIAKKEGLDVNIVPLKGGGDLINALLGKQVVLVLSGGIHTKYPEQIKTISALTTFRHPSAPDVNTIDEDGFPLGMDSRTTIILPKGTPSNVIARLSTALKAAEIDETFAKVTSVAHIPIKYLSAEEASAEISSSYKSNKIILERAGIKPK